jgi:hypothetical protein
MKSRSFAAIVVLIIFWAIAGCVSSCAAQTASSVPAFAPLDQWKTAVTSHDATALKSLYSSSPAAEISTPAGKTTADAEVAFWLDLKVRRLKLNDLQTDTSQSGLRQVVFQAEIRSVTPKGEQTRYVSEGQVWQQQGEQWRLVAAKRTDPAQLQQPTSTTKDIYPAGLDARSEIKEALDRASKAHKRVILVFGANWCYDCHVLDLAFHRTDLAPVLEKTFEVVHVDVGEGDKNQDLMQQYQVPMKRGIPGLAVLEPDGKLLYSQKNGEFEKARSLAPADLLQFLNKWKPGA